MSSAWGPDCVLVAFGSDGCEKESKKFDGPVNDMLHIADTNKDGRVSLDEIKSHSKELAKPRFGFKMAKFNLFRTLFSFGPATADSKTYAKAPLAATA